MRFLALALVVLSLAGSGSAASGLSIKVQGNRLVDGNGHAVRLVGVNRSSFEYACAQGWALWEGETDQASVAAMKAWRINTVRLPLNEACWLGLSNVEPQYRGATYRAAVLAYVRRLHDAGLYVILDLHWNAPGQKRALDQQLDADADHSPAFWRSVARAFRTDRAVLFDLYNEPHDISWSCWRNGCNTPAHWKIAGLEAPPPARRPPLGERPLGLASLAAARSRSAAHRVGARLQDERLRRGIVLELDDRPGCEAGAGGHGRGRPAGMRVRLRRRLHVLGRRAWRLLPRLGVERLALHESRLDHGLRGDAERLRGRRPRAPGRLAVVAA